MWAQYLFMHKICASNIAKEIMHWLGDCIKSSNEKITAAAAAAAVHVIKLFTRNNGFCRRDV